MATRAGSFLSAPHARKPTPRQYVEQSPNTMRKEPEFFIPVRESDIGLGRPLKWAVYNASHDLLLKRGNVVETQAQLDLLLQEGLCREASRNDAQVINGTAARRLEEDNASESSLHDFDDIRVSIGDIFSVQFQTDSPDSRCPVRLIGYLKNKSIVITTPEHQGGLIFAKEGQVFIVRFFSGKNAYAFTTEVLRVYNTPYPHLHLRYPARVKGLVVRKGERVAVKIICSIDLPAPADPARFAGTIQNLSTGGALIACKQAFAKKGAAGREVPRVHRRNRVAPEHRRHRMLDPDRRHGRDALRGQVQRHQAGNADNAHRLRLSDTARNQRVRTPSRALSLSYSFTLRKIETSSLYKHDAA